MDQKKHVFDREKDIYLVCGPLWNAWQNVVFLANDRWFLLILPNQKN